MNIYRLKKAIVLYVLFLLTILMGLLVLYIVGAFAFATFDIQRFDAAFKLVGSLTTTCLVAFVWFFELFLK